ncbi:Chromatin assembly factor 1 subunit [Elasticomyces elasticus]|nr:Chromatin assembly factor 1 subunit [Elasticomyces elasticus]
MDNVARIYNAQSGAVVRQIAEHNHFVQGVAWDPLNEYVATQSSDRSVHIYKLKTKDGQFSLSQHNKVTKMDLPARRISSSSPAPPDISHRPQFLSEPSVSHAIGSPVPSAPGTPQSLALPMNPPPTSHSRRSSFGSSMSHRRSVSPCPSMPLPAVMPTASPNLAGGVGMGFRNTNIYANEACTSFFRRLTFAPDGSLLLTPAGQYKTSHPVTDGGKPSDEIINTVYIYTRAGLNKPPVAYLPGLKKPSIAVKCSPVFYALRLFPTDTKNITIDTSAEDDIPALPEPAVPQRPPTSISSMNPPPLTYAPSPSPSLAAASPRPHDSEPVSAPAGPPDGPAPAFGLPYRIVSVDGLTLLITSSDGFCSCLTFAPGELGQAYHGVTGPRHTPAPIGTSTPVLSNSTVTTPVPTPTQPNLPSIPRRPSNSGFLPSVSPFSAPGAQPASPARSMSTSSIATQSSVAPSQIPDQNPAIVMNNPTPSISSVPSISAANSGTGLMGASMPLYTPPQTPGPSYTAPMPAPAAKRDSDAGMGAKREGETQEEGGREKRRRIQPTLVEGNGAAPPDPAPLAASKASE